MIVPAQKPGTVTLRPGQQKKAGGGTITIKFVSVVEDSRCPPQSACVWAGNAKIQVLIYDRHGKETVTMNTNTIGICTFATPPPVSRAYESGRRHHA